MDWQLVNNSVYVSRGDIHSTNIAAFDFDQTLVWSDSGLEYMRTDNDWIPTSPNRIISYFSELITDNWTIVIFINQLENNPEYTQLSLRRVYNFVKALQYYILEFSPSIYFSILDDLNRRPHPGMWDMFLSDNNIIPSDASFYCGDSEGLKSINPLYRRFNYDTEFAKQCKLSYYNPDEMLGTFLIPHFRSANVILIMSSHPSQYRSFIDIFKLENEGYTETPLPGVKLLRSANSKAIVIGERFATKPGRRRALSYIPSSDHSTTIILMFTRPVRPFITNLQAKNDDFSIRGYANALDIHLHFSTSIQHAALTDRTGEPFTIYRIN